MPASRESEEFKIDLERKGGRLLVGAFLILSAFYIHYNYGYEVAKNIALVLVLFLILLDCLRLEFKIKFPFYEPFIMHPYEKVGYSGTTFAMMGALLAFMFTDFDIAITAISMFIYGDAVAALVGGKFGKIKLFRNKTLMGSIVMFLVCFLVGFLLLREVCLALFMASVATVVESFIISSADDLALCLVTALGGQWFGTEFGARTFLQGFLFGLFLFVAAATIAFAFIRIFDFFRRYS